MKNIYDDQNFFDEYSKINQSKQGLKGAGEWQTLQKLLPVFKNKDVLDFGSGYGWHAFCAAENGASSVVGIDSSEKMLSVANEKNTYNNISFKNMDITNIEFEDNNFDIVLSSLALHYINDFDEVVRNVKRVLKNKGTFIFSVEHPIFTAQGSEQWDLNENGTIKSFPVDNYFFEGVRKTDFLNTSVIKYHRTITTYLETLLEFRFTINHVVEPKPPVKMMNIPGMKDELRRPMMLIISATKKNS
ncbi:class I SAM-dependent methyltransferase [Companilactobacillus sp. DQM5]|uniref:class I SAM-dependent methyltransferase n=1 Tax=Companilactobacillus sp. DQM5 TaxID=3463359 RepID=UPI004059B061